MKKLESSLRNMVFVLVVAATVGVGEPYYGNPNPSAGQVGVGRRHQDGHGRQTCQGRACR